MTWPPRSGTLPHENLPGRRRGARYAHLGFTVVAETITLMALQQAARRSPDIDAFRRRVALGAH